jgi:hypothetical protein
MRASIVLLAAVMSAGCTPQIVLSPVAYEGGATVTSERTARVELVSGAVRGGSGTTVVPAGTILIPIATGPYPHLQFNAEDQRIFADSFRSELQRLRIFRSTVDEKPDADYRIQLIFARTYHNPRDHEYTLDVVMEIAGGRNPFLKQYRIVSSEGDPWWERMNTNAGEGKVKAGKRLMRLLIPDIEAYVAENPRGTI